METASNPFRLRSPWPADIAMSPERKAIILPVVIITVGTGWLLTTLKVAPGIDWVWTLSLAIVGFLTFAAGGFDKVTVVIGPLFIIASCLSILRQTGRLHFDVEVPILVITAGILLLIARLPAIPPPVWASGARQERDGGDGRGGAN